MLPVHTVRMRIPPGAPSLSSVRGVGEASGAAKGERSGGRENQVMGGLLRWTG